jgi:sugar transferase (PEP-CTERM system associated)
VKLNKRDTLLIRIFRHYISPIAVTILAGDLTVLLASAGVSYWWMEWTGDGLFWPKIVALASITILLFYLGDLYNFQLQWGWGELALRLGAASAIAAVLLAAIGYALPPLRFGRMAFFTITTASTLGLMIFREVSRHLISHQTLQKRVLVLGTDLADVVLSWEGYSGALPFRVIGFLDDDPTAQDNLLPGYDLLGNVKELLSVVEEYRPDILLVALTDMRGTLPISDILECRFRGVRVEEWTSFFEKLTGRILVNSLRPAWLVFSDGAVNTRLTDTIRRILDVVLSLTGIVLSIPILGIAALGIKLDSAGPILFRQERVGKDGQVFMLYKLRSMRVDAEQATGPVWASEADPRVTRVGRVLRQLRLDEIPQMFNVLIGNMSFIGPRPERPVFVDELKEQLPFYVLRFAVKPGITGWAQVMYRYGSTVEDALEKLQYDLYYVKNMSIFLDFLILLKSVQVVLLGRGAR